MANRYFVIPLLVGAVAADRLFVPDLEHLGKKLLDNNDPGYQDCVLANNHLAQCISSVGGNAALSTIADSVIAPCVCCVGTTDIAPAFSTCSSYLSAENPLMTTQISAYSYLYSACTASPKVCATTGAGSGSSQASKTADNTTPKQSATNSGASQTTSNPMITSAPTASVTAIQECTDMVDLFTSCTYNTPGFASMGYPDQASCYCCRTSHGSLYSTNQLDQYAQTCRDWATSHDSSIYSLAKTFASFCDTFSDACNPLTSTDAGDSSPTKAGQTSSPAKPTASAESPKGNGASSLKAGYAVGMVAFAAAFIATL